jgi:ABC-2 type transport system ATP-binding protein
MTTIEFKGLRKAYKDVTAVEHLDATAQPGRITGFLGPNGAGKSTALRCLLGLATPTSGQALIGGKTYSQLIDPLKQVGAVLDSSGFNGSLTANQNMKIICTAAGISHDRIRPLLELVELGEVGRKRTKGFSLGMRQRLSLAVALLGDPQILVLDEPANGLDPIGIAWLRKFLRDLADTGKTILVSSHQLAELEHTVDDVIILNHGKLIAAGPLAEIKQGQGDVTEVDRATAIEIGRAAGARPEVERDQRHITEVNDAA